VQKILLPAIKQHKYNCITDK